MNAAVLTKEVAYFPCADADVTGGDIRELADMAAQFRHEALTEPHDFGIAFTLGIKVAAALGTAHGQAGEAVLQNLFETEDLQNGQVDGGMKAKTALEGADRGVSAVDVMHAGVIHPGNPEADHALRFHKLFNNALLFVFRVLVNDPVQTFQNFQNGLMELALIGIAGDNLCIDTL